VNMANPYIVDELRRRARNLVSLDTPTDESLDETLTDLALGFVPVVGTAQAGRDFERSRRDNDKLGMGLSAAAGIPVVGGVAKAINTGRKTEAVVDALRNVDPLFSKTGRKVYKKFKTSSYGDGRELVGIVDLPVDEAKQTLGLAAFDDNQRKKIMTLPDSDIVAMQNIAKNWINQNKQFRVFDERNNKSDFSISASNYANLKKINEAIKNKFGINTSPSSMSDSSYVYIDGKKIRISDHALPERFRELHGQADLEIDVTKDSAESALKKIQDLLLVK